MTVFYHGALPIFLLFYSYKLKNFNLWKHFKKRLTPLLFKRHVSCDSILSDPSFCHNLALDCPCDGSNPQSSLCTRLLVKVDVWCFRKRKLGPSWQCCTNLTPPGDRIGKLLFFAWLSFCNPIADGYLVLLSVQLCISKGDLKARDGCSSAIRNWGTVCAIWALRSELCACHSAAIHSCVVMWKHSSSLRSFTCKTGIMIPISWVAVRIKWCVGCS